jgi:3-hydroxyisobutyrate dehydrogenase
VVAAGKVSIVASGDDQAYRLALPYLSLIGPSVTYVGEGELARIVKICHNVYLGVVAQSLAEITVLAEKGGVPRHTFLEFINNSVMGSMFSRYKSPAYVNLDFKPTFTPLLLRKDLDLGLAAARSLDVPLPLAAQVREIVQTAIGLGYRDCDFAALVEVEGKAAGMELKPENVEVDPGI